MVPHLSFSSSWPGRETAENHFERFTCIPWHLKHTGSSLFADRSKGRRLAGVACGIRARKSAVEGLSYNATGLGKWYMSPEGGRQT